MKFIKSKEFITGAIICTVGLLIGVVVAVERVFAESWFLVFLTIPLALLVFPIAYYLYKANHLYDKPIEYTVWKDHKTKTIGFTIWGPDEKRHYTIFKIVYKDGTTAEHKVVSQSDEYQKLMKYWKPRECENEE